MQRPILKKIYRLPINLTNDSHYPFVTDDGIDSAIDEYNKREHKALVIFDKNKQPKTMNVEIREVTRKEVTISCNDKNTIEFLDKFPTASAVVVFIPKGSEIVKGYRRSFGIEILNIYYLPINIKDIGYGNINKEVK